MAHMDYLQEDMFDHPPEILDIPIDLSPMREILNENIETLSLICQKTIVHTDLDKFMKFNQVLFYKFKDEGKQNRAAFLIGLSTYDGKITYLNYNLQGQGLIEAYLHEFCHNFYRFMWKNNQPDCLSPLKNKSLMILKSRIELRQKLQDKRKLLQEPQKKKIDQKDFNKKYIIINKRIINQDETKVPVESGAYFDFHVLKKAINPDPYSLLLNLEEQN